MLNALRRLRRTVSDESGVTLVELLVSMSLVLILSVICTAFLVGSKTAADRAGSESLMAARVRVAMSSVIRLIGLADSNATSAGTSTGRIDTMTATHLVFYSDENGNRVSTNDRTAPYKIDLQFSTSQLVEQLYKPTSPTPNGAANYPATPTSTVIMLGGNGVDLGTGSGFTYCTGAAPAADGSCTTTTDPTQVAWVSVTMVVAGNNRTVQTFASSAALPGGAW